MRRAALIAGALLLSACDLSMTEQDRHETAASPTLWRGGPRDLPPPAGTVDQGAPERARIAAAPPPVSLALLERGRSEYEIYCTPCHGAEGAGDGPVVSRGFPRPRDFAAADQRALTPQQLFQVISGGSGVMYGFDDRVAPEDRWAIAAYVRAIQKARASPTPEAAAQPVSRGAQAQAGAPAIGGAGA